jgi:hypothetical protein
VKKDKEQAKGDVTKRNLVIVTECLVNRPIRDETYTPREDDRSTVNCVPAIAIDTSRGVLPLASVGKPLPKVILAVGCMPAASLLLNSFELECMRRKYEENEEKAGKRYRLHRWMFCGSG